MKKESTETQRQLIWSDKYCAYGQNQNSVIRVWCDPVKSEYSATQTPLGTTDERNITENYLGRLFIQIAISVRKLADSDELAPCGCAVGEICEECNPVGVALAEKYGCKPSRDIEEQG